MFNHCRQILFRAFFLIAIVCTALANVSAQTGIIDSLILCGKQLMQTSPDSAITVLQEAERLALDSPIRKADVYRQMSNAYHFLGKYEQAILINNSAINIRKSLDPDSANKAEMATLYYNNALNYQYLNDYKQAIQSIEQTFPLHEATGNSMHLSVCYDLASIFHCQLGEYFLAQDYAYKELAVCEKINDVIGITYAKELLASIKDNIFQYEDELALQMESLELRREIGDSVLLAQTFNNIGITYLKLEDYDSALVYLRKALKMKKSFTKKQAEQFLTTSISSPEMVNSWRERLLVGTIQNISIAMEALNQADSSIYYGETSCEYIQKIGGKDYDYAISLRVLGNAYVEKGNYAKACKYFNEAISISRRNGYKNVLESSLIGLSEAQNGLGNYKNAYLTNREAMYLNDTLFKESMVRKMALMESEYKLDKQRHADSIFQSNEIMLIEAEHEQEIKRKQSEVYILLTVFAVIMLIAIILFRWYRTSKDNKMLMLKHKALETEQALMHSQMNPHFIFNAMNSIQHFIATSQTIEAERYLAKFARLIRFVLDSSTKQSVLLSEELQFLSLYLDIEKMRFTGKFNYEFDIDDNVSEDIVSVPPMLLQPLIENSIVHGVMHKEDGIGLITIRIEKYDNDTLQCSVIDNGIGRKAAYILNQQRDNLCKSTGMELTRERIKDLNKPENVEKSYMVTDLEDENGKALGTKTTILMPVYDI